MNPRLISLALFLILIVAVVPLVMRMRMGAIPDPVQIAELDFKDGRGIRVTVELNSQKTISLHYHVHAQGTDPGVSSDESPNKSPNKRLVEHAFFGTLPRTSPPPEFVTYTVDGGDLIGIAQASVPDRIIILHDFASGDSWPMRLVTYKDTDPRHFYPYYEKEEQIVSRGEALFLRLSNAHAGSDLELLRTMGSRPLTVPTVEVQSQSLPPDESSD